MTTIAITKEWIQGAVSLEPTEHGVRPWRLPQDKLQLFREGLVDKAGETAGVRVSFAGHFGVDAVTGEARSVELEVAPTEAERQFDLVADDKLVHSLTLPAGEERCSFHPPAGERFDIYLPQKSGVILKSLSAAEHSELAPIRTNRLKWVTYGSSITQCSAAASPSLTWPAIVARSKGWDLTCLGYGGQCHLETLVARMIRDTPADLISLCLGINVMSNTLNIKTFRSAVIGMVELIREKHVDTPIVLISPIYCSYRETTENAVGMTLTLMREEIREAVSILQAYGDRNLRLVDGLRFFGEEFAGYMPDQLHPNAEGYGIMGERMIDILTELDL
ncbi:SGNH/GDSL hydrolase family protein [Paenibacillus koleovorans]|uniref:SGNH/GDSL hydrolase family protein n=1 Tax=Paenibacillus koleovorans TaxID=121608 RepID=UPI000FDA3781|nr:SGNH/GDSL hydrolase family protein [Paenibacillus koleovorans]